MSEMLPIGLRNNNPCNIRFDSGTQWDGAVGSERGFVKFIDMAHGVRAAAKLLRNYMGKHGLTTIDGIIRRWAPPEDHNPTEDYIHNVCDRSGFDPLETLSDDKPTIRALLFAMIVQEQGISIGQKDLEKGVDLAFT